MKTFWRVLETLAVVTLVLVWPLGAFAQIGKITSPGGSGATPQTVFDSTACTSAVGTDAYACSPATSPCPAALANGQYVFLTTDVANTGAATFAYCGLAAKAIVWPSPTASVALVTGDMLANVGYLLQYNATGDNWKLGFSSNTPSVAAANTWTGAQTFVSAGFTTITGVNNININTNTGGSGQGYWDTGSNFRINGNTSLTPDSAMIALGTTSNSLHVMEQADAAASYDFNNGPCGTSACNDPTLITHTSVQDTTQYWGEAVAYGVGGATKTLTESSATAAVRIPVAALTGTGGRIEYTIYAADATDNAVRSGSIGFAVVAKGTTETCTLSGASEAADGSVLAASSASTLTYAITCDTTPANAVDIAFNAVSSLTQTTLQIRYKVRLYGPGLPARQ